MAKKKTKYQELEDAIKYANVILSENGSHFRIGASNQNYRVNIGQCRPDQLQSDGWQESTNIRTLIYGITYRDAILFVNAMIKGFFLLTNNKAIL